MIFVICLAIAFVLYALVAYFRKAEPTAHALWIIPLIALVLFGLAVIGFLILIACCMQTPL